MSGVVCRIRFENEEITGTGAKISHNHSCPSNAVYKTLCRYTKREAPRCFTECQAINKNTHLRLSYLQYVAGAATQGIRLSNSSWHRSEAAACVSLGNAVVCKTERDL